MRVLEDERGTRLVWIADLLPDAMAPAIRALMDAEASAIQQTLER